jgi:hypothetical protein
MHEQFAAGARALDRLRDSISSIFEPPPTLPEQRKDGVDWDFYEKSMEKGPPKDKS